MKLGKEAEDMTTQKQEIDETEQIDFIGYMDVQHHINRIGVKPVRDECPVCVREERDRLREQVALLLELDESGGKREQELREERDRLRELCAEAVLSFDTILHDTSIGKNPLASGIVRGAFIETIDNLREALEGK